MCSGGGSLAAFRAERNSAICSASFSIVGVGTSSHPSPMRAARSIAGAAWAPLRIGGRHCSGRAGQQERHVREIVEARHEVVLAGPDRIEAERADEPRLLQRLGEPPGGIVALAMLRVQIDAELHGLTPP